MFIFSIFFKYLGFKFFDLVFWFLSFKLLKFLLTPSASFCLLAVNEFCIRFFRWSTKLIYETAFNRIPTSWSVSDFNRIDNAFDRNWSWWVSEQTKFFEIQTFLELFIFFNTISESN